MNMTNKRIEELCMLHKSNHFRHIFCCIISGFFRMFSIYWIVRSVIVRVGRGVRNFFFSIFFMIFRILVACLTVWRVKFETCHQLLVLWNEWMKRYLIKQYFFNRSLLTKIEFKFMTLKRLTFKIRIGKMLSNENSMHER